MKILKFGIVLLFFVTLWGCGKGNPNAPVTIDPVTKKHPAGWAANGAGGTHPDAYFANAGSCEECHGKPSDQAGGISRVSCSNPGRSGVACHPSFPHAAGFADFAKHGSVARDVAIGVTGMAHCQKCHGSSYTGTGLVPSCIGCHKGTNPSSNAPHAANWVNGNANGLKHSATDVSNAPACAQCHLGGGFSHVAPSPAPAGTAPGCFNGTMCHNNAGHALPYVTGHRADAKANLASCQQCHATTTSGANPRFNLSKGTGVLNPNGCENCHNRPGLAHPYMWLTGRGTTQGVTNTTSHATAGTVNVSCGLCHGGSALTGGAGPSCMGTSINGTACHTFKPVDSAGITVGCKSCHGNPPDGGATAVAPNRDYRHMAHFSPTFNLAGLTCNACHAGFGTGTKSHATMTVFTVVSTAMETKFDENGLRSAYSATTQRCTNVSCHGGRTIPINWKAALVFNPDNPTGCAFLCHAISQVSPTSYAGPYIGPFSGTSLTAPATTNLHKMHGDSMGNTIAEPLCAWCHDTTLGAGHWANIMSGRRNLLNAPRIAAATIKTTPARPGQGMTGYTPGTGACLTIGCHTIAPADPRFWF